MQMQHVWLCVKWHAVWGLQSFADRSYRELQSFVEQAVALAVKEGTGASCLGYSYPGQAGFLQRVRDHRNHLLVQSSSILILFGSTHGGISKKASRKPSAPPHVLTSLHHLTGWPVPNKKSSGKLSQIHWKSCLFELNIYWKSKITG